MLRKLSDLADKNMRKSFAIQRMASAAERNLWRSHGVTCFELTKLQMNFVGFAEALIQAADSERLKQATDAERAAGVELLKDS